MTAGGRRPVVAGNWKLHLTVDESVALARGISDAHDRALPVDLVVAPTFPALHPVASALDGTGIAVAAQDVYWEPSGAFTGEVSAPLLQAAGCRFGIVGHSERRQIFGETDDDVRRKRAALVDAGLVAIVCVGETLEQRDAGDTETVVLGQVRAALDGVGDDAPDDIVIAYEPVWAIGTGKTAAPADAQAVHAAIRGALAQDLGEPVAARMRILYGGSVKPANCPDLFAQPDLDGALVGGASLEAGSFVSIAQAAAHAAAAGAGAG